MAQCAKLVALLCAVLFSVILGQAAPVHRGASELRWTNRRIRRYQPPRFTGFERFDEWKAQAVEREYGAQTVLCNEVPEPKVPKKFPSWMTPPIAKLKANKQVKQLRDPKNNAPRNAFLKGKEIVVKTCSFDHLYAAVHATQPDYKANTNPKYDIYFHCGKGKHVIKFKHQLEFGTPGQKSKGVYRLLAPNRNVELNGDNKTRILLVRKGAHLTVYGMVFKFGWVVNWEKDDGSYPAGGYSGGAILANFGSALTVYKCEFLFNKAYSYHARWGGGGAIKAETHSHVLIWGCLFDGNRASGGGAIATSSATVLHTAHTTFLRNTAVGGVDDVGRLLIHGGAVRIDSVSGHKSDMEHVLFCSVQLTGNKLAFYGPEYMPRYGYKWPKDAGRIRAYGAAIAAWNKTGKLNVDGGDHHFLTMNGCNLNNNMKFILPQVKQARKDVGAYVFQAEGAGHADIRQVKFVSNNVAEAVAKFDNSSRFKDSFQYKMFLKEIWFFENGDVPVLKFEHDSHKSKCIFEQVSGVPDGKGDCAAKFEHAADVGNPIIID